MRILSFDIKRYLEKKEVIHKFLNENYLKTEYELASLKNIVSDGIYYLEKEYIEHQIKIKNSLIITNAVEHTLSTDQTNVFLIVENPQIVFYQLCQMTMPPKKKGVHPTAVIDVEAIIGENCYIGPYAVIGKCTIEQDCYIDTHVIIGDNVIIKNNTKIEPNSYIGANGVAWIWDENGERVIQPQFGGVLIEENCFIGSDVSIVKGSVNENTTIKKGTLIAHGSKIGHGSILEENCHLANNVTLAGNSRVGARSFLGAASVLSSHVHIAEDCIVGAGAVVAKSFFEPFAVLAGVPAKTIKYLSKKEKLNGVPKRN